MSEIETAPKKRGPKPKSETFLNSATTDSGPIQQEVVDQTEDRVFTKKITYTHDLFKLLIASFKKNVEIDGRPPRYEDAEHVHWFHTIDSDGKTQIYSNPVGGHFHKMKVVPQGPGKAPLVTCDSGPLKKVSKKNEYGKWITAFEPFNAVDHHTHEVQYLQSGLIEPRKRNVEAAIYTSTIENKTAPIDGVQG